MKLEYNSKSQEYDASGTASATKVILSNSDGAVVPVFLPADKIDLSNSELFELALEVVYQENFPNRAENEKFSAVDKKLAEVDEALSDFKKISQEKLDEMTLTFTEMFLNGKEADEIEVVIDESAE